MAMQRNIWNDKNHDKNVLMADNGGGRDPNADELNARAKAAAERGSAQYMLENAPAMPTYGYVPSSFGYQYGYKPTQFQYNSQYADLIAAASDRLRNWNYNPDEDVSYNAYRNQYTRGGQQAMTDALARYATRTGGVANSYAASAAQQQYNNYMAQLAAKVPELERLAYDRAVDELDYYTNADNTAYGRAFNEYVDWENRRREQADTEYENAYRAWQSSENARAAAAKNAYNAALAQWEQKYGTSSEAYKKAYGGSGTSGSDREHSAGYDTVIKQIEKQSDPIAYLDNLYASGRLEGWEVEDIIDYYGLAGASQNAADAASAKAREDQLSTLKSGAKTYKSKEDQVRYLLGLLGRNEINEDVFQKWRDELGLRDAYEEVIRRVNPSYSGFH